MSSGQFAEAGHASGEEFPRAGRAEALLKRWSGSRRAAVGFRLNLSAPQPLRHQCRLVFL